MLPPSSTGIGSISAASFQKKSDASFIAEVEEPRLVWSRFSSIGGVRSSASPPSGWCANGCGDSKRKHSERTYNPAWNQSKPLCKYPPGRPNDPQKKRTSNCHEKVIKHSLEHHKSWWDSGHIFGCPSRSFNQRLTSITACAPLFTAPSLRSSLERTSHRQTGPVSWGSAAVDGGLMGYGVRLVHRVAHGRSRTRHENPKILTRFQWKASPRLLRLYRRRKLIPLIPNAATLGNPVAGRSEQRHAHWLPSPHRFRTAPALFLTTPPI